MKVEFVKGIVGDDVIFQEQKPWFVFVGRSNVGKSSLLNSIFKRNQLARTSKTPGKTTEMNFYNFDDKFFIVDTPGYGYAKLPLKERQKIRQRLLWFLLDAPVPVSKKVFVLIDGRIDLTANDQELIEILIAEKIDFVLVATKRDKLNQKEIHQQSLKVAESVAGFGKSDIPLIWVSSKTNFGIENLMQLLF